MPEAARALTITVGTRFLLLELGRREIDGDLEVVRPCGRFLAGLPQHPLADRDDQAGFLRNRDEVGRRDRCRAPDASTAPALRSR